MKEVYRGFKYIPRLITVVPYFIVQFLFSWDFDIWMTVLFNANPLMEERFDVNERGTWVVYKNYFDLIFEKDFEIVK